MALPSKSALCSRNSLSDNSPAIDCVSASIPKRCPAMSQPPGSSAGGPICVRGLGLGEKNHRGSFAGNQLIELRKISSIFTGTFVARLAEPILTPRATPMAYSSFQWTVPIGPVSAFLMVFNGTPARSANCLRVSLRSFLCDLMSSAGLKDDRRRRWL